jgi:hypothetical protein
LSPDCHAIVYASCRSSVVHQPRPPLLGSAFFQQSLFALPALVWGTSTPRWCSHQVGSILIMLAHGAFSPSPMRGALSIAGASGLFGPLVTSFDTKTGRGRFSCHRLIGPADAVSNSALALVHALASYSVNCPTALLYNFYPCQDARHRHSPRPCKGDRVPGIRS